MSAKENVQKIGGWVINSKHPQYNPSGGQPLRDAVVLQDAAPAADEGHCLPRRSQRTKGNTQPPLPKAAPTRPQAVTQKRKKGAKEAAALLGEHVQPDAGIRPGAQGTEGAEHPDGQESSMVVVAGTDPDLLTWNSIEVAPLAVLEDRPVIAPRGRFDLVLCEEGLKMVGKAADFEVPYRNMEKLVVLELPEPSHIVLVVALAVPVSRGLVLHNQLLLQLRKDCKAEGSEEQLAAICGRDGERMDRCLEGMEADVVARLLSNLTGARLSRSDGFCSAVDGSPVLDCVHQGRAACLWLLDTVLVCGRNITLALVHQPDHLLCELAQIREVKCSGDVLHPDECFRMAIVMHAGQVHVVESIDKEEAAGLLSYLQKHGICCGPGGEAAGDEDRLAGVSTQVTAHHKAMTPWPPPSFQGPPRAYNREAEYGLPSDRVQSNTPAALQQAARVLTRPEVFYSPSEIPDTPASPSDEGPILLAEDDGEVTSRPAAIPWTALRQPAESKEGQKPELGMPVGVSAPVAQVSAAAAGVLEVPQPSRKPIGPFFNPFKRRKTVSWAEGEELERVRYFQRSPPHAVQEETVEVQSMPVQQQQQPPPMQQAPQEHRQRVDPPAGDHAPFQLPQGQQKMRSSSYFELPPPRGPTAANPRPATIANQQPQQILNNLDLAGRQGMPLQQQRQPHPPCHPHMPQGQETLHMGGNRKVPPLGVAIVQHPSAIPTPNTAAQQQQQQGHVLTNLNFAGQQGMPHQRHQLQQGPRMQQTPQMQRQYINLPGASHVPLHLLQGQKNARVGGNPKAPPPQAAAAIPTLASSAPQIRAQQQQQPSNRLNSSGQQGMPSQHQQQQQALGFPNMPQGHQYTHMAGNPRVAPPRAAIIHPFFANPPPQITAQQRQQLPDSLSMAGQQEHGNKRQKTVGVGPSQPAVLPGGMPPAASRWDLGSATANAAAGEGPMGHAPAKRREEAVSSRFQGAKQPAGLRGQERVQTQAGIGPGKSISDPTPPSGPPLHGGLFAAAPPQAPFHGGLVSVCGPPRPPPLYGGLVAAPRPPPPPPPPRGPQHLHRQGARPTTWWPARPAVYTAGLGPTATFDSQAPMTSAGPRMISAAQQGPAVMAGMGLQNARFAPGASFQGSGHSNLVGQGVWQPWGQGGSLQQNAAAHQADAGWHAAAWPAQGAGRGLHTGGAQWRGAPAALPPGSQQNPWN